MAEAKASAWGSDCDTHGESTGSALSPATALSGLDTSAGLTLIEDKAGAEPVQELLEKVKAGEVIVLVSFMSFMEV